MNEFTKDALYHHGVKGMHWGERNGPPYPISKASKFKQEMYEKKTGIKLPASRFTKRPATKNEKNIKKGNKVWHVTTEKDFDLRKEDNIQSVKRLYAFSDGYDKSIYTGFFAAWRKNISKKPVYLVEMELNEDLKLADNKKVSDIVRKEALNSDGFRRTFAHELANDIADHSMKPPSNEEHKGNVEWIYNSIIDKSSDSDKISKLLIQYGPYSDGDSFYTVVSSLKKEGYNGLVDYNDQREKTGIIGARMPFMMLEPLKTAKVIRVSELTDSDIVKEMKKHIEDADE